MRRRTGKSRELPRGSILATATGRFSHEQMGLRRAPVRNNACITTEEQSLRAGRSHDAGERHRGTEPMRFSDAAHTAGREVAS